MENRILNTYIRVYLYSKHKDNVTLKPCFCWMNFNFNLVDDVTWVSNRPAEPASSSPRLADPHKLSAHCCRLPASREELSLSRCHLATRRQLSSFFRLNKKILRLTKRADMGIKERWRKKLDLNSLAQFARNSHNLDSKMMSKVHQLVIQNVLERIL